MAAQAPVMRMLDACASPFSRVASALACASARTAFAFALACVTVIWAWTFSRSAFCCSRCTSTSASMRCSMESK